MSNVLLKPEHLCKALRSDGQPCGAPRRSGRATCIAHCPSRLTPAVEAEKLLGKVNPSESLDSLAHLDLTDGQQLIRARTGVWQHLLAGSLPPHVAKVALDVAETIASSARKATSGTATAARLRATLAAPTVTPAPVTDGGGEGETAGDRHDMGPTADPKPHPSPMVPDQHK